MSDGRPKSIFGPSVRVVLVREGDKPNYGPPLRNPEAAYQLVAEQAALWDREHFLALVLDARFRLLGVDEIAVGSLSQSIVHPREVFKAAILANAAALICVHNHPSGDPRPSREDHEVTRRLREAGDLLGVQLLDHLVVCRDGFYSFAREGGLDSWER